LKEQWCIPPKKNGLYVFHMEDVLRVYTRPYNPHFPQLCMDETSRQLLKDKRPGLPSRPGDVEKYDSEYEREGVCNIFLVCEPLTGKRSTKVTARRTKGDWAQFMREIIDLHYPKAEKMGLVMDNLNTHSPASFYDVFPPVEAERLSEKLEIHYTPTHGSWLNMAEIELAVLAGHPLKPRIGDPATLEREVSAWQETRNAQTVQIDWRFTTADARIKLKRLYPSTEPRQPLVHS
jgi:DDE superfamily endonuclease